MHKEFQRIMGQATDLTRRGDLAAATRAIQEALSQRDGDAAGDVIDVEAREVPGEMAEQRAEQMAEPPVQAPVPPDARDAATGTSTFTSGRYGGTGLAGRDYKLFAPAGAGTQPLPLVLMLHGCTQDPDDFAAGTRMNEFAAERGFYVLYPSQARRANPQRCWSWFKAAHQSRGRGEAELLAGMVRETMAHHAIDPNRVYVAGLSAGGAMAAILAAAYPDLFAAVGVHSGLAPGVAPDLPSALDAMKRGASRNPFPIPIPAIVFHGDADATVHPSNAGQVIQAAATSGPAPEREAVVRDGRRKATRQVHRGASGEVKAEHWTVHGSPHAWSGGSAGGSYTDPQGPDASAEMLRFFFEHPKGG